jgi:hypothetical protein
MATAAERRRAQNRGVKAGAVRIGAKGKTVRRYNPKTGRWDVTKKNVKPGVPLAAKPSSRTAASKPVKPTVKGARSGPLSANTGVQYKAKTSNSTKDYSKNRKDFMDNPLGYIFGGKRNYK